jgi:hypothetical protein
MQILEMLYPDLKKLISQFVKIISHSEKLFRIYLLMDKFVVIEKVSYITILTGYMFFLL